MPHNAFKKLPPWSGMSRDAGLDFDPSQSRRRLVGKNRNREPGQTLKGGV
jgi:hypothetical protein